VWNVSDLEEMALQPCHFAFQINHDKGFLDLQWYQRSVDTFLGGPFNIASYGILLHMIAYHVGMKPRNLIGSFGDTHLYSNHLDAIRLQLTRSPNLPPRWQPKYDAAKPIWDVTVDELLESIYGYNPHPAIKAAVAV
jgi:thymidylate synthase